MTTTRSTTTYSQGDVVLVGFTFSDESGDKKRPALVVSSHRFNDARGEVVLAGMTSNVTRILVGEFRRADWQVAGLRRPSAVSGILRTTRKSRIIRTLGRLTAGDWERVASSLRVTFGVS